MNLENFFTSDLVEKIFNTLKEGNAFSLSKDGLTINANNSGNTLTFNCSYRPTEDNTKKIRTEFYNFCDTLNQDLFVETCESIDSLKEISDMIENGNEQQVQNGINVFMTALRTITVKKLTTLNKEIEEAKEHLDGLVKAHAELTKVIY